MKYLTLVIAVIALGLGGASYFNVDAPSFGGTTNFDALTLSTGPLTVTSTNSATSTTQLGCIQTTATSTATPIRIVIGSSGATTTFQGASSVGVVGWQYGSCPI